MPFVAWPEIEALYLVRRSLKALSELVPPYTQQQIPTVKYRGKVKLDGTNAAVRIEPVEGGFSVTAQSRSQDITIMNDNAGFAAWVAYTSDYWRGTFSQHTEPVLVYGEWCGIGIQKGTSVALIKTKMFVVFSIQIGDRVITDPEFIRSILCPLYGKYPDNLYVLPWYGTDILTIDYADQVALDAVAEIMNQMVLDVEACDPWVKEMFGVEGVGEGIVFYPVPDGTGATPRHLLSRLMFKAKGAKHRVKAAKVAVEVDLVLMENTEQFVATFVTVPRCEQGLTVACGGDADPKNTGKFLKWLSEDVIKEGSTDLEDSGMTWKQVAGAVQNAARKWFLSQVGK